MLQVGWLLSRSMGHLQLPLRTQQREMFAPCNARPRPPVLHQLVRSLLCWAAAESELQPGVGNPVIFAAKILSNRGFSRKTRNTASFPFFTCRAPGLFPPDAFSLRPTPSTDPKQPTVAASAQHPHPSIHARTFTGGPSLSVR